MLRSTRKRIRMTAGLSLATAGIFALAAFTAPANAEAQNPTKTTTPIKHLVVIFGENVSFDHYFGTYPNAANTDGTPFTAAPNTPAVNTLTTSGTLTNNPNLYAPQRLTPAQALTCDQNHSYTAEQAAVNGGKMDMFVQKTSTDTCSGQYGAPGLAMDYYDGNTVTGLWNYAQNYAM
ncbi:MAG: phospholipase, partial [Microbacteriaceae bacterium]|nr:phospholipase [Microbacteriaceae bacterium]